MRQLNLFEKDEIITGAPAKAANHSYRHCLKGKFAGLLHEELRLANLVSYVGNKGIPVLRLYRYKEAFAFRFVEEFISRFGLCEKDYIFDPFCGMGTTLFAASQKGIPSIGVDKLPIAVFVAQTLPLFYTLEPGQIKETFEKLRTKVLQAPPAVIALDVTIMKVAFPPDTLLALRKWKTVIDDLESPLRDVFLLLFLSILEPCSYTSKDGQFLRLIREKKVADTEEALQGKVYEAERDIRLVKEIRWKQPVQSPAVYLGDTRNLSDIAFECQPTAIITSPPYANRYDYTRTYSLELCFHFVRNFAELKDLRFSILRSHIESKVDSREKPPHRAVSEVVDILRERGKALNNPRIPDMLTGYFVDMQRVITEWAWVLGPGARVAMVVDNVRFEGESLPVDLVLSDMAEEAGFQVEEIIVARYKGNSSQQMGKYGRVPVRESIVIWRKP
ncbi:MAG: site-specific DNA-methyltransferase [Chloroflexi bacterium]|nr:site-specific DNA-methyltransferase [Chloroflexota bacterium]MCL5075092.1 site-specific DNA-methyltransferase [Chloroflexota bacterium]